MPLNLHSPCDAPFYRSNISYTANLDVLYHSSTDMEDHQDCYFLRDALGQIDPAREITFEKFLYELQGPFQGDLDGYAAKPCADYHEVLNSILNEPTPPQKDRTGTGRLRQIGHRMTFSLVNRSIPLLNTKKMSFKTILGELLWFLSGSTSVRPLQESGIRIWDEWAAPDGELGPLYGSQWRTTGGRGIDQLQAAIDILRRDPASSRAVVSAWNVEDIPRMALPPCHFAFQLLVNPRGTLDCVLSQRSGDMFLGVPYNMASYAILTHMVAACLGRTANKLVINLGDAHVYANHIIPALELVCRHDAIPERLRSPQLGIPLPPSGENPTLQYFLDNSNRIRLWNYFALPSVAGKVAV